MSAGDDPVAYYEPAGPHRFAPTLATESPWDTAAQHGGPPMALAARVMADTADMTNAGDAGEAPAARPPWRLTRISVDFLGTIPRRTTTVTARMVRPGRRIRLLEADVTVDDRPVAVARAWQIAAAAPGTNPDRTTAPGQVPEPQPQRYFPGFDRWGYGESIDWRWARGSYQELGPADVWTNVRLPLLPGEPVDALTRALVVADSANGVSCVLPGDRFLFVPPTVTVTLHRLPTGPWVRLAAETSLAGDGIGSTLGVLGDEEGPIGSVTQPLLTAPR